MWGHITTLRNKIINDNQHYDKKLEKFDKHVR